MNEEEKASIARQIAAEGVVLLSNVENTLPLTANEKIAFIGNGIFDYQKGGLGSADVMSEYCINIVEGLSKKEIPILEKSAVQQDDYNLNTLNEFAKGSTCAIISLVRISSEGADRDDFDLSEEEINLFCNLEKSDFEKAIVVLNVGGLINVAQIMQYKKVKAVLIAWQAGMEGGNAVADVLCGDVNPCGKLTDTIAYNYSDYPSSLFFKNSCFDVYYSEDIYVGYRYFETFAKHKVLYPFGYGLSYTEFELSKVGFSVRSDIITVKVNVKNTGKRAGREVVQIYASSPQGKLEKPAIELRAYAKTRLLKPDETQTLCMSFPASDMSCFDETQASYILEKGTYRIYAGSSVREIEEYGTYHLNEEVVVENTTLKFSIGAPYKINGDGKFVKTNIYDASKKSSNLKVLTQGDEGHHHIECANEENLGESKWNLYDVSTGRISLNKFVESLSVDTLIDLAQAQPPGFVRGTGGIGNVSEFGIPSPQTADGPAGVRKTVPTGSFPCATLLACTWDEAALEKMGEILGTECVENDVDILLAPGLNIHRDPLCGRNFEYYSEDPLVAGKSAASIVRGIQLKGVASTIKHFALNNCETNRKDSNSVVSERALREIYLRAFQIAINEGSPWCLMTSYNLVNGLRTSANYNLLTGILREEWKYDGLIMTDWRVFSHLWEELLAGSNVKMPFGYPEEIALAKEYYNRGLITRKVLEKNAEYILKTVMKTHRFKNKDFGKAYVLSNSKETVITAAEFTGTSTTWAGSRVDKDGFVVLEGLGLDPRGSETYIYYNIVSKEKRSVTIGFEISCNIENMFIEIFIDNNKVNELPLPVSETLTDEMHMIRTSEIEIPSGTSVMKVNVKNGCNMNCVNIGKIVIF